jgi:hypothetical protein
MMARFWREAAPGSKANIGRQQRCVDIERNLKKSAVNDPAVLPNSATGPSLPPDAQLAEPGAAPR